MREKAIRKKFHPLALDRLVENVDEFNNPYGVK